MASKRDIVGRLSSTGVRASQRGAGTGGAGSGDPAYKACAGADAGSGDTAYRMPAAGVSVPPDETSPRRLRRLHRIWPDREGNISYLLTICVEGRARALDNDVIFERFVAFLLDSPARYHWFGRRFVIMPDHIHLIARMGYDAGRLGQWMKALKAVVGGLERREVRPVGAPGLQVDAHEFTRVKRAWRWQEGFHDHKFRTPESETRKWEYVCLNPVRAGLVKRPEEWPFGGEIYYDEADGPRLVRGTPPLLETGMLIEETRVEGGETPAEGSYNVREDAG